MSETSTLGTWADNLQPASWRGIPFEVTATTIRRGRRTAVHDYPYRDLVFVEDMGRARREIEFTGFLVGDDVLDQQQRMLDACEQAGAGTLVHPALGSLTVALVAPVEAAERAEMGRVIELSFSFVETADSTAARSPVSAVDTQGQASGMATAARDDVAGDFTDDMGTTLEDGPDVVDAVCGQITQAGAFVSGLLADPANALLSVSGDLGSVLGSVQAAVGSVYGAVSGAVGSVLGAVGSVVSFGRFAFLDATSLVSTVLSAGAGIFGGDGGPVAAAFLSLAATNRAAAQAAFANAFATAQGGGATGTATAIQSAVTAFAACWPPAPDLVRVTGQFLAAVPVPVPPATVGGLGIPRLAAATATAALFRRTACLACVSAAASYAPTSYDDAAALRSAITALLDAEITVAGDAGDDRSYAALRAVRAACVSDLTRRGASLARMTTVTRAQPLPSLVLAWQLYADATRADELLAEAGPANPVFMPLSFEALSQ
jgi:prophage DNA circulation protein